MYFQKRKILVLQCIHLWNLLFILNFSIYFLIITMYSKSEINSKLSTTNSILKNNKLSPPMIGSNKLSCYSVFVGDYMRFLINQKISNMFWFCLEINVKDSSKDHYIFRFQLHIWLSLGISLNVNNVIWLPFTVLAWSCI